MNRGLISVIVPIYNVETYLNKCVESITSQTYTNLEIILVDDGSPDHCGELCDAWAEKDKRIHVIHKRNGGLSDARNEGLRSAVGEYVTFVDSDDWISADMCQTLLEAMQRNGADVAIGNFQNVYSDGRRGKNTAHLQEGKTYYGEEILELYVKEGPVEITIACGKLYRRSVFVENNLFYPIGRLHEDEYLCKYIYSWVEKVVYVDEPLYFYFQREESIMGKVTEARFRDGMDYVWELYRFVEEKHPDLLLYAWKRMLDELYTLLMLPNKGISESEKYIFKLKMEVIEQSPRLSEIYGLGIKPLIKFLCVRTKLETVLAKVILKL